MEKASFSSVLKNRGFTFLWLNQALMQFSINALNFSLILLVYKLTNSNFAVAALIFSMYLPAFFFGLFAGVFADAFDKKKIIIATDLLLALVFFSFIFFKNFYPLVLLNAFLINSLMQFFIPAESSAIPQLLPKKLLFLANSLFSLTLYGSFMLGYTMAGPFLDIFGIDSIFYIGVGSLLLGAVLSQALPPLESVNKSLKLNNKLLERAASETKRTFIYLRGKINLMTAIGLMTGVQMVIGILAVMVSSYMERILRIQATNASFVLMLPLGFGMILGTLIFGRLFNALPRRYLVRPAILIGGVLLFVVGIAPEVSPFFGNIHFRGHEIHHLRYFFNAPSLSSTFAVMAFLLGICTVAIIVPSQTILQENTDRQIRGKVFALLGVMMNSFAALPTVLAGGFADLFGVTTIFMAMGLAIFLIGLISLQPEVFFSEHVLPYRIREFLGLGHWDNK